MTTRKTTKLNQLQHLLPEGSLADGRWLEAKGYSSDLRKHYVRSGWLVPIARGVYARGSQKLRWQNVIYSLQSIMEYPVLVGGRTALELLGHEHYLRLGGHRTVHLYAVGRLPTWLLRLDLDVTFHTHNAAKLFSSLGTSVELERNNTITSEQSLDWGDPNRPIQLSTRERATLEMLDEVPNHETFDHVDKVFEGLSNLSPRRTQKLLEACKNVKVKRLFFWFAKRHQHAWLKHINEQNVDLGTGNRSLVPGGKLDPTYRITIPKEMYER